MTVQVMPGGSSPTTVVIFGRTYTCAVGSVITVPDADALVLMANGWIRSAVGTGTTAQRPATPLVNQTFYDTTVGAVMVFNGKGWARHDTGVIA
jgi:hypothetical protein